MSPPQRKGWVKAIRGFSLMCLSLPKWNYGDILFVRAVISLNSGGKTNTRHGEPAWGILFHHLKTGAPLPPLCPCLVSFPDGSLLLIEELLMAEDSSAEHVFRLLWFVTVPHYNEPKLDLCWQSNVLPFNKTLFYPYTPYWIDLNCVKKKKVVQQIISISSPLWWTPRRSLQLLSAWDWPD